MKTLREARQELGLTQQEAAERIGGITRGGLAYIELGTNRARFQNMVRICRGLDLDPREISEFAPVVHEARELGVKVEEL